MLQIAFAAVGIIFGWIDGGTASTLAFTGLASIGLRFNTSLPIEKPIKE